jgi:DUF1365 family protein
MADSALYVGHVRHRRSLGSHHAFRLPVWYALLDLAEIPDLAAEVAFLSHNSFNLIGFDDRDHMGFDRRPVREKLAAWLRLNEVDLELGRTLLLTQLRTLGHVFNPVSFYYCHDRSDLLRYVVAEVNNTFGETYCYLLPADPIQGVVRHTETKVFHVSPFNPVSGTYRFTLPPPDRDLVVHIGLDRDGGRSFDATIRATRRPFTTSSLAATVGRHPLTGLLTLGHIHFQALLLWVKGVRFHQKPSPPPGAWRTRHGSKPV